jgi:soluble lytic murein transglycosylase-like protein
VNRSYLPSSTGLRLTLALATAALALLVLATVGPSPAAGGTAGGVSPDGTTTKSASSPSGKYQRLWDKTSRRDKRWARRTAECESGRDPKAIGGGGRYRGAFQFMRQTWRAAPKSPGGDPIRYRYKTQAVVAIHLKKRDGAGHWPSCG